jgi:uncharacterized protein
MSCPVVHWQMLSKDPDRTVAFYSRVFDWRVDADNALGYRRIQAAPNGIGGGIWPSPPEGQNIVQLFIGVESVADYVQRAEANGARTLIPPQQLPDGDALAIMIDPLGMPFGLMKSRA